jgi:hypothetical protein
VGLLGKKVPDPSQLYHRDLGSMLGTECRRSLLVGGSGGAAV